MQANLILTTYCVITASKFCNRIFAVTYNRNYNNSIINSTTVGLHWWVSSTTEFYMVEIMKILTNSILITYFNNETTSKFCNRVFTVTHN